VERPVIFDIDYTLFSPKKHRELYLPAMVVSLGLDEEQLKEAHESHGQTLTNRSDYHHYDYLSYLSRKLALDYNLLVSIYLNPDFFTTATYPDVNPALTKLHQKYPLGIFSEGFVDLQRYKLDLPGISKFFRPDLVGVFRRKKTEQALSAIPQNSILIDDKIEIVEILQSKRPDVKPVWINRDSEKTHPTVTTIKTLSELSELLA
jgi:FMN phosphatase YigB (HAD superfamily)